MTEGIPVDKIFDLYEFKIAQCMGCLFCNYDNLEKPVSCCKKPGSVTAYATKPTPRHKSRFICQDRATGYAATESRLR